METLVVRQEASALMLPEHRSSERSSDRANGQAIDRASLATEPNNKSYNCSCKRPLDIVCLITSARRTLEQMDGASNGQILAYVSRVSRFFNHGTACVTICNCTLEYTRSSFLSLALALSLALGMRTALALALSEALVIWVHRLNAIDDHLDGFKLACQISVRERNFDY